MVNFIGKEHYSFEDLLQLVTFLRSENGCPWDHAQTHTSIRRNFLEEAYEACEGIDSDNADIMKEEFGDVLLQVVFHTDIERERGRFSIDDVCDEICKKLVRRHPHLFSGGERRNWDELKKEEKGAKNQTAVLNGVARSLPALIRSEKLVEKAGKELDLEALKEQAHRELEELFSSDKPGQEKIGRLLFTVVSAGTAQGLDCETALQNACEQFIEHFAEEEKAEEESAK